MLQCTPANQEHAEEIQALAQFIPGGLFRCLRDDPLTIVGMSDSFLRLLGYTREEIRQVYHDSFREMIDPRDWERTMAEVNEQMALGSEKELEYRMRRKDGETIWVLDKGNLVCSEDGEGSFYCLLVDITAQKQIQEELRLSLERHQIILDQTNDIIVEWDLEQDSFTYSSNWRKKFGYHPLEKNVSRDLASSSHIHQEDIAAFAHMLAQIRAGIPYSESEVRLRKTDERYLWCRTRFTAQRDSSGKTIKAVGVIIDIDEEKRRSQELMNLAQKDTLTGLYNKGTIQSQITAALKNMDEGSTSVLMVIDVDNFKTVNDSHGHLFGDEFLMGISRELSRLFRGRDIVGRIGGDEFLAYMQSLPDVSVALKRARQILGVFHRESHNAGLSQSISCSIGISAAPQHGRDFNVLFHAADVALYRAKQQGKNCRLLYDESWEESFPIPNGRQVEITAADALPASPEQGGGARHPLADMVFRILYGRDQMENAVSEILEVIGKRFGVSRAYIFECTQDGKALRNTFEWCETGVQPQIDSLQHVPFEGEADRLLQGFDKDGVLYCRDITTLPVESYELLSRQGIQSILLCGILDGGTFRGLVGFDECQSKRYWNQQQIDTLLLVSRIVGAYLLKQRAKERAEQTAREICTLLESQSSWVYVIRQGTYEMLYINHKAFELAPDVKLGMRCHEAYFGRDTPCEQCPARLAEKGGKSSPLHIYNPRYHVWSSADASSITWRGEPAILVTCHDITPLMPPGNL